jgi:AcrR family transcriptional regulator
MPYPTQIDRETIITQARDLIAAEGIEALSLSKLAASLNVKAPSLYRHVDSKTSLLRDVNLLTAQKLFLALDEGLAQTGHEPEEKLTAVLNAYRTFAHANPHTYLLAMTNNEDAHRPDENALEQLAIPIQEIMSQISGPEKSLAALRGALALVHGFVMLELNAQLRRSGDLDEAFHEAVRAYLRGWHTPLTNS